MPSKLLLIDDDRSLHPLVRAELEQEEVSVISAFEGLAGLEMARQHRPDVILLDVSMPETDGYEICELLHVQSETADIPVLFLSASSDPVERAKGLDLGAADFMSKPFLGVELRARLRVALRHKYLFDLEVKRAQRDGLTGVWNRAYFEERLEIEVAAAKRHGHALSCIMLDIDRFKSLNDLYGHPFGDVVIRTVASLLQKTSRLEDIVFRYGGEEFVVLCPYVDVTGTAILAERLRIAVSAHRFAASSEILTVTCSLGVSSVAGSNGLELVKAADRALYEAKHSGRNRVGLAA